MTMEPQDTFLLGKFMTLDKSTLEKELTGLLVQKDQAAANLNAVIGAIEMTKLLIKKLDQPETTEAPEA